MSTLEVNKITPVSGGTTVTLGDSGDTISVASGATLSDEKNYATWQLNGNQNTDASANITSMTIKESANITHSSGTFTITKAGLYHIFFNGTFQATNSTGGERQVGISIKVNGTGINGARDQVSVLESGNSFGSCSCSVTSDLSVGDTINFQISQSYAGANIVAYQELTNGTITRVA